MRLINVATLQLEEFFEDSIPPYAILSHTWGTLNEEVTFQEFQNHAPGIEAKPGYAKIRTTCQIAAMQGMGYAWVDTCCIDKSSSAELSEAINSMFRWYQVSAVCYVFLADLKEQIAFGDCRWFTRGWCLQELIAPKNIEFYDAQWNFLETKSSLLAEIQDITGIHYTALEGSQGLDSFPLDERMAWAAKRRTTRREDIAYCLLGIFEINMPLLYGEGERAFLRLQEHIIASSSDPFIFAWHRSDSEAGVSGLLAGSPRDFSGRSSLLRFLPNDLQPDFSITNRGITFSNARIWANRKEKTNILELQSTVTFIWGIHVQMIGPQQYARIRADEVVSVFSLREIDEYTEMRISIPRKLTGRSLLTLSNRYVIRLQTSRSFGRLRCISDKRCWDPGRELFMCPDFPFLGMLSVSPGLGDHIAEQILVCYVNIRTVTAFILPISEWPRFENLTHNGSSITDPREKPHVWEPFFHAFQTSGEDLLQGRSDRSFCMDKRISCVMTTKRRHGVDYRPGKDQEYAKETTIEVTVKQKYIN